MAVENGVWTMYGMDWDDPYRIRSYRELINWINEIGFLPFFKNEIEGFSAEEHTSNRYWWTGDKEQDPWEWREIIARSGEVAYGKFFHKKAGFISKEWFPYIVLIGVSNELPEHDDKYELYRLLSTLLSMELSVNEKLSIIGNEYNIPVGDRNGSLKIT